MQGIQPYLITLNLHFALSFPAAKSKKARCLRFSLSKKSKVLQEKWTLVGSNGQEGTILPQSFIKGHMRGLDTTSCHI